MDKYYPEYEHNCNTEGEEDGNTEVKKYSTCIQFDILESINPFCDVVIIVIGYKLDIKLQKPIE